MTEPASDRRAVAARWWRRRLSLMLAPVLVAALLGAAATRAQDPVRPAPAGGENDSENDEDATPAAPTSPNVRIVFKIIPNGNATVMWGKKRLGIIKPKVPLVVTRPRDSGPLDVIVRSPGYVLVHTRAYTFTNSTVAVKLTPLDKKNTLYGYREEIPPDGGAPAGGPDAGMP
ncbi:MAG: hypothetical protein ABUL67_02375 [Haliangium ochraceum]